MGWLHYLLAWKSLKTTDSLISASRAAVYGKASKPIVIRIHTTQNDNLQRAFASLVFYSLYKDMFRRGIHDRITHALIFDEAHRAAGLKLIPTMAKECRKYGISLVLASQEAKDFNVSVFSAIANYLVLRLTEVDAKFLVRNVASSQHERVLIDKIKQMETVQGDVFLRRKKKPLSALFIAIPVSANQLMHGAKMRWISHLFIYLYASRLFATRTISTTSTSSLIW